MRDKIFSSGNPFYGIPPPQKGSLHISAEGSVHGQKCNLAKLAWLCHHKPNNEAATPESSDQNVNNVLSRFTLHMQYVCDAHPCSSVRHLVFFGPMLPAIIVPAVPIETHSNAVLCTSILISGQTCFRRVCHITEPDDGALLDCHCYPHVPMSPNFSQLTVALVTFINKNNDFGEVFFSFLIF